jgi:hypothetical protein
MGSGCKKKEDAITKASNGFCENGRVPRMNFQQVKVNALSVLSDVQY